MGLDFSILNFKASKTPFTIIISKFKAYSSKYKGETQFE